MPYTPDELIDLHKSERQRALHDAFAFLEQQRKEHDQYLAAQNRYDTYLEGNAAYERACKQHAQWQHVKRELDSIRFELPTKPEEISARPIWRQLRSQLFEPRLLGDAESLVEELDRVLLPFQRFDEKALDSKAWKRGHGVLARALTVFVLGKDLPSYRRERYKERCADADKLLRALWGKVTLPLLLIEDQEVVSIIEGAICEHILSAGRGTTFAKSPLSAQDPNLRQRLLAVVPQETYKPIVSELRRVCRKWHPGRLASGTSFDSLESADLYIRPPRHFGAGTSLPVPLDDTGAPQTLFPDYQTLGAQLFANLNPHLAQRDLILRQFEYPVLHSEPQIPQKPEEVLPPEVPADTPYWATREGGWEAWHWEAHYAMLGLGRPPEPGRVLLVGYDPYGGGPITIDRTLLHGHAHILGRTRGGKTSGALAPFAIQLIRGTDEPDNCTWQENKPPPPPLLVVDFKGDMGLFHAVRIEALKRGQTFRHFTSHSQMGTMLFDPLRELVPILPACQELAEALLEALSLIHTDEYGAGYYTDKHVNLLGKAVENLQDKNRPITWANLLSMIGKASSRDRRDADHLFAIIEPMLRSPIRDRLIHERDMDDPHVISMQNLIEKREVAYFWLPSRRLPKGTKTIGKLAILTYAHVAANRTDYRRERRCYCIIDEFQKAVSKNIGELFQTASHGRLSLIAANQSVEDLMQLKEDISHIIRDNSVFKQWFSGSSDREIRYLNAISGEHIIRLRSDTESQEEAVTEGWSSNTSQRHGVAESASDAFGSNWSNGTSAYIHYGPDGEVTGESWSSVRGAYSGHVLGHTTSSDSSFGDGKSGARSSKKGRSVTHAEQIRPRVTSEDIRRITHLKLGSFVHLQEDGEKGSQLRGIPRAVHGFFPTSIEEHEARNNAGWITTNNALLEQLPPKLPRGKPRLPRTEATISSPKQEVLFPEGRDPEHRKALRAEHGRLLQDIFDREAGVELRSN